MSDDWRDREWRAGGAVVVPFAPGVERVRIRFEPGPPREIDEQEAEEWARACARNRRLVPGELLDGTIGQDGAGGARRERYERFVVQGRFRNQIVIQLSISAVTMAPDEEGRPSILLGQRAQDTRLYGGQWQICPSGGLDPPARGVEAWDHADVVRELERELREETGLELGRASARLLGIVRDHVAMSEDILFRLDFPETREPEPEATARWEHSRLRWVPLHGVESFAARHQLVDSTRAVLAMLREQGA